eukprot:Clim_evm8s73 gene=Clim_evmTU8s73
MGNQYYDIAVNLAPVYASLVLGWLGAHLKWNTAAGAKQLGTVVTRIAIPAFILDLVIATDFTQLDGNTAITITLYILFSYIVSGLGILAWNSVAATKPSWIPWTMPTLTFTNYPTIVATLMIANSVILGRPILTAVYPQEVADRVLIIYILFQNAVQVPIQFSFYEIIKLNDVIAEAKSQCIPDFEFDYDDEYQQQQQNTNAFNASVDSMFSANSAGRRSVDEIPDSVSSSIAPPPALAGGLKPDDTAIYMDARPHPNHARDTNGKAVSVQKIQDIYGVSTVLTPMTTRKVNLKRDSDDSDYGDEDDEKNGRPMSARTMPDNGPGVSWNNVVLENIVARNETRRRHRHLPDVDSIADDDNNVLSGGVVLPADNTSHNNHNIYDVESLMRSPLPVRRMRGHHHQNASNVQVPSHDALSVDADGRASLSTMHDVANGGGFLADTQSLGGVSGIAWSQRSMPVSVAQEAGIRAYAMVKIVAKIIATNHLIHISILAIVLSVSQNVFNYEMPELVTEAVSQLAALNGPLSVYIIGFQLHESGLIPCKKKYLLSGLVLRWVGGPLVMLCAVSLMTMAGLPRESGEILLLLSSMPQAISAHTIAASSATPEHQLDQTYLSGMVTISTLMAMPITILYQQIVQNI